MTELKADYRGELAQRVRIHMGRTQKEMAAMFGLSLRSWQDKEQNTNRVSVAELMMFQLLLNEHPGYLLIPRLAEDKSPAHHAAGAAFMLAQYLNSAVPLPSKADELQRDLDTCMNAFKSDWQTDLESAVGNALPDEAAILRGQLEDARAEIAELKKRLANI